MILSDTKVKQAKPRDKIYRITDEKGLYIEIHPNGSKYWRHKYRYGGKEKRLAHGVYPEVSLKRARAKRDDARMQLSDGIDPSEKKRADAISRAESGDNSFEAIAKEWLTKEMSNWSPAHIKKQTWLLEKNLFPYLGSKPISEISPPTLLSTLKRIENRGALETARRAKQVAGQIFRYAVVTGRAERDVSVDLKGALKTPQTTHFSAITEPKAVGRLLNMIDDYSGTATVKAALLLAPLVFVRPGELRQMLWNEVDLDKEEWRLPAKKMKMKQPHIVPLSSQSMAILKEQQLLTGQWEYVFPSERSRKRPMSENSLNAALRRMGIPKEEMTTHGFRALARTLLDEELGFDYHLIEHQLAHEVRDPMGRAYNRTKHLPQRKDMMQKWSDYLDELRVVSISSNVIKASFTIKS